MVTVRPLRLNQSHSSLLDMLAGEALLTPVFFQKPSIDLVIPRDAQRDSKTKVAWTSPCLMLMHYPGLLSMFTGIIQELGVLQDITS